MSRADSWVLWLNGVLLRIESVVTGITSCAIVAIMLIVFADVGLRYGFNSPLTWSYDFVSMYLMAALFFLTLSATLRDGRHVRIDILLLMVRPRIRHTLELIGYLMTLVLMAGILYQGVAKVHATYLSGDTAAGVIAWPLWTVVVFVPLGAGLLALRLGVGAASLAVAIAQGSLRATSVTDNTSNQEI